MRRHQGMRVVVAGVDWEVVSESGSDEEGSVVEDKVEGLASKLLELDFEEGVVLEVEVRVSVVRVVMVVEVAVVVVVEVVEDELLDKSSILCHHFLVSKCRRGWVIKFSSR